MSVQQEMYHGDAPLLSTGCSWSLYYWELGLDIENPAYLFARIVVERSVRYLESLMNSEGHGRHLHSVPE